MMFFGNCDLTSAFEDGGIGGIIVAVAVGIWRWWVNHQKQQTATK